MGCNDFEERKEKLKQWKMKPKIIECNKFMWRMVMEQQMVLYHPPAENWWNGPSDLCNFCYRWLKYTVQCSRNKPQTKIKNLISFQTGIPTFPGNKLINFIDVKINFQFSLFQRPARVLMAFKSHGCQGTGQYYLLYMSAPRL
jgi:hypothetical protein